MKKLNFFLLNFLDSFVRYRNIFLYTNINIFGTKLCEIYVMPYIFIKNIEKIPHIMPLDYINYYN